MKEDRRTGLWLRHTKHIRGHLWHRYCVMVNQVIMATVKLSTIRLHLNYWDMITLRSLASSLAAVLYQREQFLSVCEGMKHASTVYPVSFISRPIGQTRSTKSPNVELFIKCTPSISRNVKVKDRASLFSFYMKSPCY